MEVYALDLDEELLGHLALPASLEVIRHERVSTDLIEDEFVEKVFQWQMEHGREHKQFATATVLADEFDIDFEEPETAIGDLLDRLRDRYVKSNARQKLEKLTEAYKEDPMLVVEVMPRVAREFQQVVGARGESYGTGDFDAAMSKYDQSVLAGPGPSFGFGEVDKHFGGLKGLCFGIAPPKSWKSWIYGANMAFQNVMDGNNIRLYSLELPAEETDMRVRCLAAGIPYWKYQKGALSHADRMQLQSTAKELDGMGTYNCVKPPPGHRTFEEMIETAGDDGCDGIIIDQLQYVETHQGMALGGAEPKQFWQPLNAARDMSDDIPIMVIHQFNRSVMGADSMPEMQQAKGAAAIEEVATLALGLWANKDMRRSNLVELGTLASRNYQYESWEVQVELSHGCNFELLGRARHDEDY